MSLPSYDDSVLCRRAEFIVKHTPNVPKLLVFDKRGNEKDWSNLFAVQSTTFPPTTTNTAYGADTSLLTETYSVTSLDTNGVSALPQRIFLLTY